jgi:cell division septation protein DedD
MSRRALVISLPAAVLATALLVRAGCSRERSDWRSAQAADSPESYQQFIDEHPDSTHVATARERLMQLAEDKDWRAAAETDSLEAYQQFLVLHPGGRWAKEARVRIDGFNSKNDPNQPLTPGESATFPDATPPGAAGTSAGEYGVQLGAFSSSERANEEWSRLQAGAGGLLDGLSPRVVVGEASGKTIYRLQAQVRDEAQARAICGGLKVANKPCVPVLPH